VLPGPARRAALRSISYSSSSGKREPGAGMRRRTRAWAKQRCWMIWPSGRRLAGSCAQRESNEMELAFAGLHQLCAPMLERVDQLPQRARSTPVSTTNLTVLQFLRAMRTDLAYSLLSESSGGDHDPPPICRRHPDAHGRGQRLRPRRLDHHPYRPSRASAAGHRSNDRPTPPASWTTLVALAAKAPTWTPCGPQPRDTLTC
jgi:hypothetical protein